MLSFAGALLIEHATAHNSIPHDKAVAQRLVHVHVSDYTHFFNSRNFALGDVPTYFLLHNLQCRSMLREFL